VEDYLGFEMTKFFPEAKLFLYKFLIFFVCPCQRSRTFSASFGCIVASNMSFSIYTPREVRRQVKANFGGMKISLFSKILTRDGYLIPEKTLLRDRRWCRKIINF